MFAFLHPTAVGVGDLVCPTLGFCWALAARVKYVYCAIKARAKDHALSNCMTHASKRDASTLALLTPPSKWLTSRCAICILHKRQMARTRRSHHPMPHHWYSPPVHFHPHRLYRSCDTALRSFHSDVK